MESNVLDDIDALTEMKRQIDKAQRDEDQAKGALDQILKQINADFGVATIDEAGKLLTSLDKKLEKVSADLAEKRAELESKYDW